MGQLRRQDLTNRILHFVVPGALDQCTGGYIYDAHVIAGLRDIGWRVDVHNLTGNFSGGDAEARSSLTSALAGIPDGCRVVIDGLAMGGFPELLQAESGRLRMLALVHHPLADEVGIGESERTRLRVLERAGLGACAGVVVTSEFTARRLGIYGVGTERIGVVTPGVDVVRHAIGPVNVQEPSLLCVGSVIPRKGHKTLVLALKELMDLPWTCHCVGSLDRAPDYSGSVQELNAQTGLTGRVRFVGECEAGQLDAFYHHASLFVLPSHYEGYGMALAEAMARGLPVISTTGGAIPDTVDAEASVLVPPGDVPALSAAIRGLLSGVEGSKRRRVLASAARNRVAQLPSWDEAAVRFDAVLLTLIPDGDI